MKPTLRIISLLAITLTLQGCVAGYNSVLFATKSNIGIDVDTEPPAFDVAISRQEGTIAPTFEDGQVLPLMSSFSTSTGGLKSFFFGVGSTFSTGDAAQLMSGLYAKPTPPDINADPLKTKNLPNIELSTEPKLPKLLRYAGIKYLEAGQVKPVVFGTDTALGFNVRWSGHTAQIPSSIHIGYNRKEAAWAPVTLAKKDPSDPGTGDSYPKRDLIAGMPSLLATLESDVQVSNSADLRYLQYFATGEAANNLAKQYNVRKAMLSRVDPRNEEALGFKRGEEQLNVDRQNRVWAIIGRIGSLTDDQALAMVALMPVDDDVVMEMIDEDVDPRYDRETNPTAARAVLETFVDFMDASDENLKAFEDALDRATS